MPVALSVYESFRIVYVLVAESWSPSKAVIKLFAISNGSSVVKKLLVTYGCAE